MRIEETFIPGLKLIYLNEFIDNRGSFVKIFNKDLFVEHGLETDFKESFCSVSAKDVIRGMHFFIPPFEHTKLVYVNNGSMLDVILDIRKQSPTYGQHYKVRVDRENLILVYIPVGCAHGFRSLEDNTMVTYLQSTCYNSEFDKGIKYNSFGMDWGLDNPVISQRDLTFPDFKDAHFDF